MKLRFSTAVAAAMLIMTAAACGTSEDQPTANGLTRVTVGEIPFAELAAFHVAVEDGLFEDAGLDVRTKQASSGAALVTSLASGDIQFAYGNYVTLLQAASKGIPVEVVRENDRPGAQAIYALPGSGLKSAADLKGKKVAINSLGNIQELTTRSILTDAGVDPKSVKFVELPPPNMTAALKQKQVDAAWLVEPFITLASGQIGATKVADVFSGASADLPVAGWATTAAYAKKSPEVVEGFVKALDKASAIAAADPARVAKVIPTYTEIPAKVAAKLSPIAFVKTSDFSGLDRLQDLMISFGYYDKPVDLDTFAPRS
jgi:NitT/TauT family transport system substrate-binding protein